MSEQPQTTTDSSYKLPSEITLKTCFQAINS